MIVEFEDIIGKDYCLKDYEIRWSYAFGGTLFEKDWIPELILLPQTKEQISEVLKLANKNKKRFNEHNRFTNRVTIAILCEPDKVILR